MSRLKPCESGALQTPADHSGLDHAARLMVAPGAVDVTAGKWKLICAAFILAQHLNRLVRRRFSLAVEFSQSLFTLRHFSPSLRQLRRASRLHCKRRYRFGFGCFRLKHTARM